jgi:geranylgeranyl reductase family protein
VREHDNIFDLIIVGAGPSGSIAAIYAKRFGLTSLIVDKSNFPRDKTCGDGLTPQSLQVLHDLGLDTALASLPGARFEKLTVGCPSGVAAEIDLRRAENPGSRTGYVIRRHVFDHFLFRHAKAAAAACHEQFLVDDLLLEDGAVRGVVGRHAVTGERETLRGKIVLGADGHSSIVARRLGLYDADLANSCFAVRQYFAGVEGLRDAIEVHFLDTLNPGYFWIFPTEDGRANVGVVMRSTDMKKKGVNLTDALEDIKDSPGFVARFAKAEPIGKVVGGHLPLGSRHRKCHGAGYMLVGDAAGMIDPFTGEGISNAMKSARIAVEIAALASAEDDFSEESLSRYDMRLWSELGRELTIGHKLQKIWAHNFMVDFIIRRAAASPAVGASLRDMFVGDISRVALTGPRYYLKLLFGIVRQT